MTHITGHMTHQKSYDRGQRPSQNINYRPSNDTRRYPSDYRDQRVKTNTGHWPERDSGQGSSAGREVRGQSEADKQMTGRAWWPVAL